MNQKSYFTWTEDKKYTLAKLALRHEGYKPTDRAHQEKWENILEKLKETRICRIGDRDC